MDGELPFEENDVPVHKDAIYDALFEATED